MAHWACVLFVTHPVQKSKAIFSWRKSIVRDRLVFHGLIKPRIETNIGPCVPAYLIHTSAQALHGLALKCKLINTHELINMSTNNNVIFLQLKNAKI